MKQNYIGLILTLTVLFVAGLACSETKAGDKKPGEMTAEAKTDDRPVKAADETVRGFHFIYFKVPAGLDEQKLIETAQKLHDQEPDAQLILVDDDSQLKEYIEYAKQISAGNYNGTLPKEWADKHIVGNVQKYVSGKFTLCKGAGYKEIAELK